jgi:hypothetical protein
MVVWGELVSWAMRGGLGDSSVQVKGGDELASELVTPAAPRASAGDIFLSEVVRMLTDVACNRIKGLSMSALDVDPKCSPKRFAIAFAHHSHLLR